MTERLLLQGTLRNVDVIKQLQQQGPDAMIRWIANSLIAYLRLVSGDAEIRYISFVWWLLGLPDPVRLRQFVGAMASITCTSSPDLDTAICHLYWAKIALLESNLAAHNTRWLYAVDVLAAIPEFRLKGLGIAEHELNAMVYQLG